MYNAERYLVLGGAGFIGSHLVRRLLSDGHEVTIINRSSPQIIRRKFPDLAGNSRFDIVQGDFFDEVLLNKYLPDCSACIHLAGSMVPSVSIENKVADIEINLAGTVKLLECARRFKLRKLIYISSGGTIYGQSAAEKINEDHPTDPISAYGITKLATEKYIQLFQRLHDLSSITLRLANPFGPGQAEKGTQGAIAVFVERVLKGEPVEIWGDGSVVRDYLYIDDVVEAILHALDYSGSQNIFNIGSGQGTSLNDLCSQIGRHFAGFDKFYKPTRSFDVPRNVLDISRAQKHLGWHPRVSLASGIEHYISWRKAHEKPNSMNEISVVHELAMTSTGR